MLKRIYSANCFRCDLHPYERHTCEDHTMDSVSSSGEVTSRQTSRYGARRFVRTYSANDSSWTILISSPRRQSEPFYVGYTARKERGGNSNKEFQSQSKSWSKLAQVATSSQRPRWGVHRNNIHIILRLQEHRAATHGTRTASWNNKIRLSLPRQGS